MDLEMQIAVNQFGQGVRTINDLLNYFSKLTEVERKLHLFFLSNLLWQSKPLDFDIESSIIDSSLKPSFTPCVLLRTHGLRIGIPKIIDLPADELDKTYILLLYLFKRAYHRRFVAENELSEKWWYSDLSNQANIQSILAKE